MTTLHPTMLTPTEALARCANCGHTTGYHGATFCTMRVGTVANRPICDCPGWKWQPIEQAAGERLPGAPGEASILTNSPAAVAPETWYICPVDKGHRHICPPKPAAVAPHDPSDQFPCPMCGHTVRVSSTDEGTNSYVPVEDDPHAAAPLAVERLAAVFGQHPIHWDVKRGEGTGTRFVMTRIFESPEEAAAYVAAAYAAEEGA